MTKGEMKVRENDYKICFLGVLVIISFIYSNYLLIELENRLGVDLREVKVSLYVFMVLVIALVVSLYRSFRKEVLYFSNRIVNLINSMISEEKVDFEINKETLLSKIENKLKVLYECLELKNKTIKDERDSIKSLIGDISHQIKTPMSSINLYSETLLNRDLDDEKKNEFAEFINSGVKKIEWLIDSLFKVSRLENGVIELDKKSNSLKEILARCIGDLYVKANKKNIEIIVDFPEDINLNLDFKWSIEAIFNVLDNAIKYSLNDSVIKIIVGKQEMFTRIDICDEGIGLEESEITNVFKRFYRSKEVEEIEGAGVGLYLTRYIVEKQGGFITVNSEKFEGSKFSIYFSNEI
ncbi:MAG: sensor histidine kinase [Sarcina sp.]